MSEKILLTGGSGFIGSEVLRIARERGFDVLNLDFKPPRVEAHKPFWRQGDVRDAAQVEQIALQYQPDIIMHLASDIDVSITQLEEFKTTIDGTANMLAAAAKLPGLKRFVHVSTQFTVKPGIKPRDERHLDPYTVYGEAKAQGERLVWQAKLPVPWYILRPTIIWGPHHPSFADQIFRHIARRNYLHPVGSAPILRAYGYVTNTAEQMMAFATIDPARVPGRVYYLGDESLDYDRWADAFSIGLTGKPAKRIPVWLLNLLGKGGDAFRALGLPAPIDSGRAFRMSTASQIDLAPTHQVTGQPSVGFEQGVKETLAWLGQRYG